MDNVFEVCETWYKVATPREDRLVAKTKNKKQTKQTKTQKPKNKKKKQQKKKNLLKPDNEK